MRRTKFHPNYGYYTINTQSGSGVLDGVANLFKTVSENIPTQLSTAAKDAALNVGIKAIKAVGSKIGDKIANRILSKQAKAPKATDETRIREKVLEDLKLLPDDYNRIVTQYGEGNKRKKKVRGAGLKVLF
jgi:hypothetical protein